MIERTDPNVSKILAIDHLLSIFKSTSKTDFKIFFINISCAFGDLKITFYLGSQICTTHFWLVATIYRISSSVIL